MLRFDIIVPKVDSFRGIDKNPKSVPKIQDKGHSPTSHQWGFVVML